MAVNTLGKNIRGQVDHHLIYQSTATCLYIFSQQRSYLTTCFTLAENTGESFCSACSEISDFHFYHPLIPLDVTDATNCFWNTRNNIIVGITINVENAKTCPQSV